MAIVAVLSTVLKVLILPIEATEKREILRPQFRAVPPEATSGVLARWVFSWQLPLFRKGYTEELKIEDLYTLDKHLGSRYLQNLLQTAWSKCSFFSWEKITMKLY